MVQRPARPLLLHSPAGRRPRSPRRWRFRKAQSVYRALRDQEVASGGQVFYNVLYKNGWTPP